MRAALSIAMLLASCGSGEASRSSAPGRSPAESPVESPVEPTVEPAPGDAQPTQGVARAFCGSGAEARVRAAHPELPSCGNRAFVYVEARIGGHDLLVLAHDQDPCCTDVPSPGTERGAHVYVDGREQPAYLPLAIEAQGTLTAAEATALLAAELLRLLAIHQAIDASEVRALSASWPAARPVLAAFAPGLSRTGTGWRLRLASESRESERGVDCRSLALWEAELDGGALRTRRVALHSEGSAQGEPCPGEPF